MSWIEDQKREHSKDNGALTGDELLKAIGAHQSELLHALYARVKQGTAPSSPVAATAVADKADAKADSTELQLRIVKLAELNPATMTKIATGHFGEVRSFAPFVRSACLRTRRCIAHDLAVATLSRSG